MLYHVICSLCFFVELYRCVEVLIGIILRDNLFILSMTRTSRCSVPFYWARVGHALIESKSICRRWR